MPSRTIAPISVVPLLFILGVLRLSPAAQSPAASFTTPLTGSMLDLPAAADWVDGVERPLANPARLLQVVWTQGMRPSAPATGPLSFGASNQPGLRLLRCGFNVPVPIGSVLVRGGGQLSVLRPGAPYPGSLAGESQWLPAQRIDGGKLSSAPADAQSYALWVLPPGTTTRALRFAWTSTATDASYAGVLGGVYILSQRMSNLAPEAAVAVSANADAASRLIDEKDNGWLAWDNGPQFRHPVSSATPEWIVLRWPRPVSLAGLAALWAGFNAAEAEIFTGPESQNPSDAPESDWHTVGSYALRNQYPRPLGVDWLHFARTEQTRAVRLRLTAATDESRHPHLAGGTRNGARVWLGELMALSPIESGPLQTAVVPVPEAAAPRPPIPVRFTLDAPGYVTLVVEDAGGNRVRNLVSNTWFDAGANTAWWDGSDDLGRDRDAGVHGVYFIPTRSVPPGTYTVRGLVHPAIDLRYEFSVYNGGHPAWETADGKGGWLANHTPPSSALFVPGDKAPGGKPLVYLGSYVTENFAGLAWLDQDGNKQGGRVWIGGNWTAAPYLARDAGSHADPETYAYVGAAWFEAGKDASHQTGVIRLTALTRHGDRPVANCHYDLGDRIDIAAARKLDWNAQMGGLAVHNNLAVVSLTQRGELVFLDASRGFKLGVAPIATPRGLAFDSQGRLLALSGKRLLRFTLPRDRSQFEPGRLTSPETIIAAGLEDPAGITLDSAQNLYISDRGASNQVKVFSPTGKPLRSIGNPGPWRAGPYDPQHMNQPRGLAIDANNHLWVAEEEFQPKRVSLWTLDGKLLKAFYGPAEYGGGGTLDPQDKSLFYYNGMQFKLDWTAGSSALQSIFYPTGANAPKDAQALPLHGEPSTAIWSNGRRYFTNVYMEGNVQGVGVAMVYLDRGGIARPAAAFGRANDWDLLKTPAFRARWPQGVDPAIRTPQNSALFAWSDVDGDGQVDPGEVAMVKAMTGAVTVTPDLAMIDAYVDGKTVRFAANGMTPQGVPIYDLHAGTPLDQGAQWPLSDGGGQALALPQATIETTAPKPFSQDSFGGVYESGNPPHPHRWSYPNLWPGLHPSHSAPVLEQPGAVAGATRLLGGFIAPAGSQCGPLWAINGNLGSVYLFTADGLFVAQLFQDARTGKPWNMPQARRNMLLNDLSLGEEDFFPSLNQAPDGNIYLVDGTRTSILRVDGLSGLRRIPEFQIEVTREELTSARSYLQRTEALRQRSAGTKTLEVTIRSGPAPALKDFAASLATANWATIDRRIAQSGWNSNPDVTEAAVAIASGRLYAAFNSDDPQLLANSGAVANAPFKTGGALDLMIGADPQASPDRETPVAGDVRLLVYQVDGATRATLYRAVVPGTKTPVPFSSPWRTVTIDQVLDVSPQVELIASAGKYAFSIPLATLGLKPAPGEKIKADIGILRGNGAQTVQRVYWSDKATGITADVPSEATLTPSLWGEWIFKAAP